MITAIAFVLASSGTMTKEEAQTKPIPEVWAYVKELRAERKRTMIRSGLERDDNQSQRNMATDALIDRVRYKPYKLGPGLYLIHEPNAGLYHLEEIKIP